MTNYYHDIPMIVSDYLGDKSLNYKVDGLIINSKLFSTSNSVTYNYRLFKKESDKIKKANKKVLINLDRIIPENEIELFKEIVLMSIELCDYLIYSDLAVLNIVPKSLQYKLIYDPKTLICSKEEFNVFPTNAFISNELSFKEIKEIATGEKKIMLDVFGYLRLMYSRRPLLSLCMPKGKIKTNTLYNLKEETRNECYKIYETKRLKDNYGTYIYNYSVYVLFKELFEIIDNVKLIRINALFLEDKIEKTISIYNKVINSYKKNGINNEEIEFYYNKITSFIENNHLIIDRGFLDQESVLLKEACDE